MKTYSFRIVVEPDGERWHAFCPVLVEHGGYGSQTAAPVARALLEEAVSLGLLGEDAREREKAE